MKRTLLAASVVLVSHSLLATELNVAAASSLTDALKEIGATYEKQSSDHIAFNFAASSLLARQIEEGAPTDIFFSADNAQMDRLERSGSIDPASRHVLLSNRLVIAAAADSRLRINSAAELRAVEGIAVGDPKLVPVGVYTRGYLEKLGVWKELEPKIVPTENVRAALATVESGNADVAFVYASDALISKRVKVLLRVPAEETPPIEYPAAIVKSTAHRKEAEAFLKSLASQEAAEVFEKFGFIVKR